MSQSTSDAEFSEQFKSLKAKIAIFSTLGTIFYVMTFIPSFISILSVIIFGYLDMSLLIVPTVPSFILGIKFSRTADKLSYEQQQLILKDIQNTLKNNFELIEYNYDKIIPEATVRKAILFNWISIRGNGFINAVYRDAEFIFCNLELESRIQNSTFLIFGGQLLSVPLAREITPSVTITELSGAAIVFDKRKRVMMEDAAFNQQFHVVTEDAQKAFYILTPQFMAFIMSLKWFVHNKIHICFSGFSAHIAIQSKQDYFVSNQDTDDILAVRKKMQREADFIKRILDGFLQNERLFGPRANSTKQ